MPDGLLTPLYDWHRRHGGKMTPFAGYQLPLSYTGGGVMDEHLHTRRAASLFDVSHMGQVAAAGDVAALSLCVPADVAAIVEGKSKYTMLTNEKGGIIDDCIIANDGERGVFLVLNASRKEEDLRHLNARLNGRAQLHPLQDRALLAVQGPAAVTAVGEIFAAAATLSFMESRWLPWRDEEFRVARCGYTGEDGFEISSPAAAAELLATQLCASGTVKPAGLGARDSLRMEAGLCLYGNDIDEDTSPVEAGLLWTIPKSRRIAEAEYPGAAAIAGQISTGGGRKLVGLLPQGKVPVRAGAELSRDGAPAGKVTSGVFSPLLKTPIAMGYVQTDYAAAGGEVTATVRGKSIVCRIVAPPFVPHNYCHSPGGSS